MKHIIIGIVIILSSTGLAFSQVQETSKTTKPFNIGLNLGTNLSIPYQTTELRYVTKTERTNAPAFGWFSEFQLSYHLSEQWSAQYSTGINLIRHQYEMKKLADEEGHLKIYGLNNSLSLKYHLSKFDIFLSLGIYYSYLVDIYEKGTEQEPSSGWNISDPNDPLVIPGEEFTFEKDWTKEFEQNEYGLFIEAGKTFKLNSKLKLNSFIRYHQSLVNIYPSYTNEELYNMYFSVGVGIVY